MEIYNRTLFVQLLLLFLGTAFFAKAQVADQRAENMQIGLQNIFMSADQSYYKFNSASDNNPYVYGYWVIAHGLETLADAYQRTRNVVYYNRMKSILAGIRKYNLYEAGTYRNDYYDDLEWLGLASLNCYFATKDTEFLDAAHQIWAEIKTGYSGGKMSWRKGCTTPCNNSIANSPAIVMAVKLYKLANDAANLQMAKDIHAWMKANVFNANGGIWDSPGNFDENWQFSYNSGMFISASLELYLVTGTQSYLDDAIKACEFMMNFRNYDGGVFFLNETGQGDGGLFKGIFAKSFIDFVRMGNLTPSQRDRYMQVIQYTANYVWDRAVNKSNYLTSPNWSVMPSGTIDLSTHLSGVHLFESVASLNKVHAYRDINYSGFYSQLAPGMYTLAQLQAKGITDNDITSLTIPSGYSVTVYENDNFSGASATYTSNQTWLASWNDRISSLRIVAPNPSYRIKNRWQNTYLYDAGDRVRYNATASGTNYQWVMEDVGGGLKELKNVGTGEYMHVENLLGYVQCTARTPGWWSSRWATEDAGNGYVRIRNGWQSTKYIHVENLQSQAQYGDLNSNWHSMQWVLEPITAASARLENTFETEQDATEERVKYWPNEVDDQITLQTNGTYRKVEVTDFLGRVQYQDNTIQGKKSLEMDLSHLSAGIHFIRLTGAKVEVFRIIVK
ncbi:MAG TPA: glycoside hydrolase family 76 protein [Cytophagales bacterium]|nr:glycoside hydrolase family 76 protein [Cytophagales bacterium]